MRMQNSVGCVMSRTNAAAGLVRDITHATQEPRLEAAP